MVQPISAQCFVSYRKQSFVLQSKANDWFLYGTQHGRKGLISFSGKMYGICKISSSCRILIFAFAALTLMTFYGYDINLSWRVFFEGISNIINPTIHHGNYFQSHDPWEQYKEINLEWLSVNLDIYFLNMNSLQTLNTY